MSWMERFQELVEFKRLHGHCNVTQHDKFSRSLGNWVSKQRQRKKRGYKTKYSKLSQEQVDLLDKIGFEWDRSNWAQKNQKEKNGKEERSTIRFMLVQNKTRNISFLLSNLVFVFFFNSAKSFWIEWPPVGFLALHPQRRKLHKLFSAIPGSFSFFLIKHLSSCWLFQKLIKIRISRYSDPFSYWCYICARTIRELKAKLQICFGVASASFFSRDKAGKLAEFPKSLQEIDPSSEYVLVEETLWS